MDNEEVHFNREEKVSPDRKKSRQQTPTEIEEEEGMEDGEVLKRDVKDVAELIK